MVNVDYERLKVYPCLQKLKFIQIQHERIRFETLQPSRDSFNKNKKQKAFSPKQVGVG